MIQRIVEPRLHRLSPCSRPLVARPPTLHRGQATMLCALAGLYKLLQGGEPLP